MEKIEIADTIFQINDYFPFACRHFAHEGKNSPANGMLVKFIAQIIVFGTGAYFIFHAIGFWRLLFGPIVLTLASTKK
ncbi:hypothetical protein [Janthinobacterium sp. 1_2014MBL_MicDiv]|uniref:hypothetical protein n=1 Tax=Janthinobacterium sp. 1_2014MBL_MicDiv TaxID=1644131 RepID=UPI0012ECBA48|nr:hypothetical protein [Janthinobacterium sp. 1_2014MBL_MicDiv]